MVDAFYDVLTIGFKQFIPLKNKSYNSHPPWYSKNLSNLKNRMSRAHKEYKRTGLGADHIRYCSLRNQFDTTRSRAYNSYLDETQVKLIADPSKFWSYVNSMKKTVGYPSYMHLNGDGTTNMELKCDLFARFFKGVFVDGDSDRDHTFGLNKKVDIGFISLNEEIVLQAMNNINVSKGDGPDNISQMFLRKCSNMLVSPLLQIFNMSLNSSFPSRWKESYVVPIFKSGSRSNVEC